MTSPLSVAVIVGSTREGRFGPTVGAWVAATAADREDLEVDVVDVRDLDLPPVTPRAGHPTIDAWAARADAADAFVVVTPEYNHSYPAPLKHAIDLLDPEWHAKPVGFVTYGGVSGGLRASEHLRQVFAELHATTVRETVSFHGGRATFGADGRPLDPVGPTVALGVLLDQLAWWGRALRHARAERPYGS